MPACFSMLLSVPIGISRTGCGTVTRPGFTGCLNCLWLPTCATSYQPSCFKRCTTSRLDIKHDTHFLHTCQVEVYMRFTGATVGSHWMAWAFVPGLQEFSDGGPCGLPRSRPVSALAEKG